jgi:hypothetical protein
LYRCSAEKKKIGDLSRLFIMPATTDRKKYIWRQKKKSWRLTLARKFFFFLPSYFPHFCCRVK